MWFVGGALLGLFSSAFACLEAPYLYVTFHGGAGKHDVNTIVRYAARAPGDDASAR
jgi:hypothetical protein